MNSVSVRERHAVGGGWRTGSVLPMARRGPARAPDLPANVVPNRRRAPALPDLDARPAVDPATSPERHSGAPATLSRQPEVGVLEAVARAVAALEERIVVVPENEVQAIPPSASAVRSLERGADIETRILQWALTRFDDLSDPERFARGRETYADIREMQHHGCDPGAWIATSLPLRRWRKICNLLF